MATQKSRFKSALDDGGGKAKNIPTQHFSPEDLNRMCAEMLVAAGGTAADAEYVAGTLINASLAGVDSHGIIRMERYVAAIEEGSVRPQEEHELIMNKGSMALMDGKNTFGQVVARDAMALCIEKVREHGLAMVSCVNTGHIGRVGEYALTAARAGFVALCCVNGGAIVAPFGSKGRVLGTNPICCAMPVAEGGDPILIDLAVGAITSPCFVACLLARWLKSSAPHRDCADLHPGRGQGHGLPPQRRRTPRRHHY